MNFLLRSWFWRAIPKREGSRLGWRLRSVTGRRPPSIGRFSSDLERLVAHPRWSVTGPSSPAQRPSPTRSPGREGIRANGRRSRRSHGLGHESRTFVEGHRRVVLIGSDVPHVPISWRSRTRFASRGRRSARARVLPTTAVTISSARARFLPSSRESVWGGPERFSMRRLAAAHAAGIEPAIVAG